MMPRPADAENKCRTSWICRQQKLHLLYVTDTSILELLLLLFYQETGYAIVESQVRTTRKQHRKSRSAQAGIFIFGKTKDRKSGSRKENYHRVNVFGLSDFRSF